MTHEESRLQAACVRWFRMQHHSMGSLLFAVPNGGARGKVEACILKSEGVTAGVADLILLIGRGCYNALCIEMKTEAKTSRQSPAQKAWQTNAEIFGSRYVVCRTLDEFMHEITEYLKL
ncbi:MAG: VRR-NUC domain-containing protein, partial [Alistipes sp.]